MPKISSILSLGKVCTLISNLDPNCTENDFIKYETCFPHESVETLHREVNEFHHRWDQALKDMLAMIEQKDYKINPTVAKPTFETPVKSNKQIKRGRGQITPSSSSVSKAVYTKRSKRQSNDQIGTTKSLLPVIDNQENDQNLINQANNIGSFVAKESSLDVIVESKLKLESTTATASVFNPTPMRTRSQTRYLTRQQKNRQEQSTLDQSSFRSCNQLSKQCASNYFNTPKQSSRKNIRKQQATSPTNNNNKDNQHQVESFLPLSVKKLQNNCSNTPRSKQHARNPSTISTPSSSKTRPPDDILKTSVEKVKKAAENRQAILQSKTNALRQRSLERKNRLMANQQKQEEVMKQKQLPLKLLQQHEQSTPTGQKQKQPKKMLLPVDQTPPERRARHQERLKKLQGLCLLKNNGTNKITSDSGGNDSKKDQNVPIKTSKKLNSNSKKLNTTGIILGKKNNNEQQKDSINVKKLNDKMKDLDLNDTKDDVHDVYKELTTRVDESTGAINHHQQDPPISPIIPSEDGHRLLQQPDPNLTFNAKILNSDTSTTKTPIVSKTITKLIKDSQKTSSPIVTSYQMTPPSRRTSVVNYDISALVDSDDEEAQVLAEKRSQEKPIPQWANGKQYAMALKQQFGRSQEEFRKLVATVFPNRPKLPVDLDAIGLQVISRYRERTSSIIWDHDQRSFAQQQTMDIEMKNATTNLMSEDDDTSIMSDVPQ